LPSECTLGVTNICNANAHDVILKFLVIVTPGVLQYPPNEVRSPTIRNADLRSVSLRQNTNFRVIEAEGDSKKSFLPDYPESTSCYKQRPQTGPRIFGPIISKSTQRPGACGGHISPGSTGRIKDLTKGPRAQ
jgi:hypothetical protein